MKGEKLKIYHITTSAAWKAARQIGNYQADSYPTEGFIHCSTAEQVIPVANRVFKGQKGLVLLEIDSDKVTPAIRWENLEGGTELFPHIYGPINISAVLDSVEFLPQANGCFHFPYN